METVSRHIVQHAQQLAREVAARVVLVYIDALREDGELLPAMDFPTIFVTRSTKASLSKGPSPHAWVRVPDVPMTRAGQVKSALLVCLARGVLHKGDRVVCLTGVDGSGVLDTLLVLDLSSQPGLLTLACPSVLTGDVAPEVFKRVLTLATQLAVEGREGRPVGRCSSWATARMSSANRGSWFSTLSRAMRSRSGTSWTRPWRRQSRSSRRWTVPSWCEAME
jgi:hypothetical protein